MIEEQHWDAHRGNRLHRRLIAKSRKGSEGSSLRSRGCVALEGSSAEQNPDSDKSLPIPL